MSSELSIRSRSHDYSIRFAEDLVSDLEPLLKPGDVILLDEAVAISNGKRLAELLSDWPTLKVAASEHAKSFEEVGGTIDRVISSGFRRDNRLFAIGGGVLQDIVAFMATVLYRGVEWVFVPTTLLAQGDSCLGGKSSINFRGHKNLLGSFLPPRMILIDTKFLRTLPEVQVTSGIGEILHFLVFSGEDDFAFLEANLDAVRREPARMRELIGRSLAIKKPVVEEDELDQGVRQLFNYGHSFGHAIEAVSNYEIPHGIAVSFGIDIANYVSAGIGMSNRAFRDRVRAVASRLWDGFSIRELDLEGIFAALRRDKKNIGKDVYVILARDFGALEKVRIDLDGREGALIREYFAREAN